ncbi:MAG: hypothetical protein ACM3PY_07525, partial [Omnitrophica WOR_2 bacterium]
DYTQVKDNVTRTSFENFTVIANWSIHDAFDLDGMVLPPQGMWIQKNDGTIQAGIYTSYNGTALSPGEHYLIEERQKDKIVVRQPSGANTSLTLKLLPGWNGKSLLKAQAFSRDGALIYSTPVAVSASGATFTYTQDIPGSAQVVDYYEITTGK